MQRRKQIPIPFTVVDRSAEFDQSTGPAAERRLGRTPDTVPANTSAGLHEGGPWAAAAATTDSPGVYAEARKQPPGPYAIDEARALMRRRVIPDCVVCERLECTVAVAGRRVKEAVVELCADYVQMYTNEVKAWEEQVRPLVDNLENARSALANHQTRKGHTP